MTNDKKNIPVKRRLKNAGYDVERIEMKGRYLGVRILKDGVQVHSTPRASFEFAIELCEEAGY